MRKSTGAVIGVLVGAVVVLALLYKAYGGDFAVLLTNPGDMIDRVLKGLVGSLAAFGQGLKGAFPRMP